MWSSRTVEPSQELDIEAIKVSTTAESARRGGSELVACWKEERVAERKHGEALPQ